MKLFATSKQVTRCVIDWSPISMKRGILVKVSKDNKEIYYYVASKILLNQLAYCPRTFQNEHFSWVKLSSLNRKQKRSLKNANGEIKTSCEEIARVSSRFPWKDGQFKKHLINQVASINNTRQGIREIAEQRARGNAPDTSFVVNPIKVGVCAFLSFLLVVSLTSDRNDPRSHLFQENEKTLFFLSKAAFSGLSAGLIFLALQLCNQYSPIGSNRFFHHGVRVGPRDMTEYARMIA